MWVYPVDMKRANEFGQVFTTEPNDSKDSDKSEDENEIETNVDLGARQRKASQRSK